MTLKNLFFDLDGTIVDSGTGIINGFRYAFDQLNLPQLSDSTLNTFIGPPLEATFLTLSNGDEHLAETAINHYRAYYASTGMLESAPYADIVETLSALSTRGYTLYIATSKKESVAIDMLKALKLSDHFDGIFGSTPQTMTKTLVLKHALKTTRSKPDASVMIGDREFDIIGGLNNDVSQTVGVLWGFGDRAELEKVGCDHIITHPKALLEIFK